MRTAKPSVAELRAVCQPADIVGRYSGEHWAGRLYGRRVSIYVTWFLVRTGLSANAITILMALVGVAGAALFGFQGIWGPIAGAAMIQVYLILDCSDGEVARWRGTTGASGIFLDRLGHYVVEATLFIAMGARAEWFDPFARSCPPSVDPCLISGPLSIPPPLFELGLIAALLHVIGKVETDLVHVARGKAGLSVVADDANVAAPRVRGLAHLRRAAGAFPLYRLTGAIEASVIALGVILTDEARGTIIWTRYFVWIAVFVTALIAVGHLVMILASNRLR